MYSRIRIIAVFVGIATGIGVFPYYSLAGAPHSSVDLFAVFRPFESPTSKKNTTSNASTAAAYHRLAKSYADQNNGDKANTNFRHALQCAAPWQVANIAADYASFLSGTGNLCGAELILRQALTQSPNNTELVRMLARCLVQQEKVIEGRRHFLLIGTEAEASAEIAAICREQGNMDMLARVEQKWGIAKPNVISPAVEEPDMGSSGLVLIAEESKPVPVPALPSAARALSLPLVPRQLALSNPVKLASAPLPMSSVTEAMEPQKPASTPPHPRKHYVVNADASSDLNAILSSIKLAGL